MGEAAKSGEMKCQASAGRGLALLRDQQNIKETLTILGERLPLGRTACSASPPVSLWSIAQRLSAFTLVRILLDQQY